MKRKVMFISSEGGHLYELRQIDFTRYNYSIVTEKTKSTKYLKNVYNHKVHYLLYGTRRTPVIYFFILLINFFISLYLFLRIKPDVVVSTGTHTAVSMCYIAKIFRKKVIWIETFANRNTGTLAGKIVYPIADKFIVQWEEMKKVYKNSYYFGSLF